MPELRITTERAEMDVGLIHRFLSQESSWARGIPLATVQRSLEASLCFGGFLGRDQVAFAASRSPRAMRTASTASSASPRP